MLTHKINLIIQKKERENAMEELKDKEELELEEDERKKASKKKEKKPEKKPLGIRADEELTAEWREFLVRMKEELGISAQDAALRELLKLADIEKIRQRVPERAGDIDDFRTLLEQLLTKFLSSVDAATLAKKQARDEVLFELDTQTRTIADLQSKQDELKERISQLENALDVATTENNRLQIEVNKLTESIVDKDTLIQSLKNNAVTTDAITELREFMASIKKEREKE